MQRPHSIFQRMQRTKDWVNSSAASNQAEGHARQCLKPSQKEILESKLLKIAVCLLTNGQAVRNEPLNEIQTTQTGRSKVLRYYNNSTPGGRVSSVPQTLDFRNQRFDTTRMPASIPKHLWDMRREENRWQSFHLPDASFTASQLVSVTDLAADGFFYLQESDRVKRAFCKGVLKDWEAGEQVREAHRRHFSTCPFVLGHCL